MTGSGKSFGAEELLSIDILTQDDTGLIYISEDREIFDEKKRHLIK